MQCFKITLLIAAVCVFCACSQGTGGGGSGGSGGGGGGGAGGGGGGGSCTRPTDVEFCEDNGKTCGDYSGTDICGNTRTSVHCGDCTGPATCSTSANVCVTPAPAGRWVMGYHPDYEWNSLEAGDVPWTHLTHILLGFLEPTLSGSTYGVTPASGWHFSNLGEFISAAQGYLDQAKQNGVKVLATFGGDVGDNTDFLTPFETTNDYSGHCTEVDPNNSNNCLSKERGAENPDPDAAATALAKAITTALEGKGFDGVDIDWEGESFNGWSDGSGLARLIASLRSEWPEALITVTVGVSTYSDNSTLQKMTPSVAENADALMIMSYIPPVPQWGGWVGALPVTPLHSASYSDGSPVRYSIDTELSVWPGLGLPAAKMVMGIGGFGQIWVDSNNDHTAPVNLYTNVSDLGAADTEWNPSNCADNRITQAWVDQVASRFTLKTDNVGGTTYYGAPAKDNLVSLTNPCNDQETIEVGMILYESPTSMTMKGDYLTEKGMRGAMFWTLNQLKAQNGTFPLLEVLKP